MLALNDFRTCAKGLPDLLTYAALVAPGVVLQKDGSCLAGYEVRGQDTASAVPAELERVSMQTSAAIKNLGAGWMLHVDASRTTRRAYPDPVNSRFPDRVSRMLDEERRSFFRRDICHVTTTFIVLTWLPDASAARMAGAARGERGIPDMERTLERFEHSLAEFEDACTAGGLRMRRLGEYEVTDCAGHPFMHSDLLAWLQSCVSGVIHPFRVPATPMYLDALLGEEDLVGGLEPCLGKKHLAVISIDGLPQESWPSMLSALDLLPFELRYSTRFICLDQFDAEKEITMFVKGWNQKVVGFLDQFLNNPNPKVDRDALLMREDAETAKTDVQSGIVGAGYLTSGIILMDEDRKLLEERAREVRRLLQSQGFGCRIESINVLEAWLGSLPGNSFANVRRPLISTLNLADLLPLHSVWTGSPQSPCPFYPPDSPPLAVFLTDGTTPFNFNLHVGDLGHTLIFGPTGAGKSTLLAEIVWNFRRYAGRIFAFDKGESLFPLCAAMKGAHYDIGGGALSFAPLARIDGGSEQAWAEEWIAGLLELQNVPLTPPMRNAVHKGMELLRAQPENMRSLTHFTFLVPDEAIREALQPYTSKGVLGTLLDAETDELGLSSLVVFEVESLLRMGDNNAIPVLNYLFHRIEGALDGTPSLLVLDEAWIMLGHPVFRAKIREWLKVLRKANCAVVMATQSLSDAQGSGIMDVLVESCPTKIYLPNSAALSNAEQIGFYKGCGLNERQIAMIGHAVPKRDYYMVNDDGRRLFQLGLSAKELAFVGASDKESIARVRELMVKHGPDVWVDAWLEERNAL